MISSVGFLVDGTRGAEVVRVVMLGREARGVELEEADGEAPFLRRLWWPSFEFDDRVLFDLVRDGSMPTSSMI